MPPTYRSFHFQGIKSQSSSIFLSINSYNSLTVLVTEILSLSAEAKNLKYLTEKFLSCKMKFHSLNVIVSLVKRGKGKGQGKGRRPFNIRSFSAVLLESGICNKPRITLLSTLHSSTLQRQNY